MFLTWNNINPETQVGLYNPITFSVKLIICQDMTIRPWDTSNSYLIKRGLLFARNFTIGFASAGYQPNIYHLVN